VFCDDTQETLVDGQGQFAFYDLPEGIAMLVVTNEQRILLTHSLVLSATTQPPLELDVATKSPLDFQQVIAAEDRVRATEKSLHTFLQNFAEKGTSISYSRAWFDLNGDGTKEAIAFLKSPGWCGTGGCTTLVLKQRGDSFELISKVAVSRLPVVVLPRSSHGWRHLSVRVAGGGIMTPYDVELPFDGTKYAENPTVPPASRMTDKSEGEVLIRQ
jgi:hypothetical protein